VAQVGFAQTGLAVAVRAMCKISLIISTPQLSR